MRTKLFAVAVAAALCACGGGGGDDTPTSPGTTAQAKGLWVGTTNTNRAVTGLVFSDGTYYLLYSVAGNSGLIAGVTQGHATANGPSFSSSDGRDFNFEGLGVLSGSVTGTYVAKQTISGTVHYASGGQVAFTGSYDAAYEQQPTYAAIAGTYTGQVASPVGVQSATFSVAGNGVVTGSASGCAATGALSPRGDGNAYDATVTFGPSPCVFAGQTFTGAAYYNAATKRIYAAAPNAARTSGVLLVGVKP